jgi:hypothetical protein
VIPPCFIGTGNVKLTGSSEPDRPVQVRIEIATPTPVWRCPTIPARSGDADADGDTDADA